MNKSIHRNCKARWCAALTLCGCFVFLMAGWVRAAGWGDGAVEIIEMESGVKPAQYEGCIWSATGNGCRIARIQLIDARWLVHVDGKAVSSHDEVDEFRFSPDGGAYSYRARRLNKRFYVINGAEQAAFDKLYSFVFSEDGKRHAYLAGLNGALAAVIDGKAHFSPKGWIPWQSPPVISPEGSRVAWVEATEELVRTHAHRHGKMRVVIDGNRQPEFECMGVNLVFSNDGRQLAHAVFEQGKACFVVDGKREQDFEAVGIDFVFSPDGKHHAYFASTREGRVLVVDGVVKAKVEGNLDHVLRFSPDSSQLLYGVMKRDETCYLVVGDKVGSVYESIGLPPRRLGVATVPPEVALFSPDGKHVAYLAKMKSRFLVVRDGVEGKARCDRVVGAYGADLDGTITLHWGGPLYKGGLIFSPDSRRVALVGDNGFNTSEFVIVDDEEQGKYAGVTRPSFSPDGKHLAYAAKLRAGERRMFVVVDGIERQSYEAIVAPPVFRDDGILEFIALQRNDLVKVRVKRL